MSILLIESFVMESVVVKDDDVFCEIVKISYGKGAKNPVSGPTAFYEPKKATVEPLPSCNNFNNSSAGNSESGMFF